MGFQNWLKNRKELKAIEDKSYDEEKVIVDAKRHSEAIKKAEERGKEKANRKRGMPNPKKIEAIKKGLMKAAEKMHEGEELGKSKKKKNYAEFNKDLESLMNQGL